MPILNDFAAFEAKHCETAATRSLLRHCGLDFSEPMLLGLSRGFGFIYWKMSFMNLPFIGGRAKPFELTRVFCEEIGLEVRSQETSSRKKAWANVSGPIDEGVPVGLQVDCYHLEHFHHSFHFAGHFIAVYGYDEVEAYVFDTGRTHRVSLTNLEKARFEKGSMAAKARSYTIHRGAQTRSVCSVIPGAVRAISSEFLNPPLKCFGYFGIQKLAGEMRHWFECAVDPKRDLLDQAELMENGGTGGAIFRNLFRDFLHECLEYLPGTLALEKGASLYSKAASDWTEIARLIARAAETGEQAHLDEASAICLRTAETERSAMEALSGV